MTFLTFAISSLAADNNARGGCRDKKCDQGAQSSPLWLVRLFFFSRLYISSGLLPQSTATSSNIQRFRVPISPDSCHRPWGVSARVGGFGCGGGRGRASRPVDQRRGRWRGSATMAGRFALQGKGRGNGGQKQKDRHAETAGCKEETGSMYLDEGEGWNAAGLASFAAPDGVE